MKIILKSSLIALLVSAFQISFAGTFIDSASVVSVDKVYKQVRVEEPYQECYIKETVQNNGDGSATNEIIGGIIGGAIGNQFGEGDGKDAMTLAGIFLGASLAHDDQLAQGPGVLVTKCYTETRYGEAVQTKVYSHSTLAVRIKGKDYVFNFVK